MKTQIQPIKIGPNDLGLNPDTVIGRAIITKRGQQALAMATTDPLVRATRKARSAHAKTLVGQLEALLREESKWKRRTTIASNKLAEVRDRINNFARLAVSPVQMDPEKPGWPQIEAAIKEQNILKGGGDEQKR